MSAPDAGANTPPEAAIAKMGDLAADAGLRRINVLAWRDYDDPEAGGSEVHTERLASAWTEAGIEVTTRSSFAPGHPVRSWRNGHRVIRKGGRYLVFPRAAISEIMRWHGPRDALFEVWNGIPFFSPLWDRAPRAVFLHHFHAEMWDMTFPPRLAKLGRILEQRIAPPLYRGTPVLTPSESSKTELVRDMGFRASNVTVAPPGVDARFRPGGTRSPTPLVVAVGRLVPVKRFDLLFEILDEVRRVVPDLRAVVVGDGYLRDELEAVRTRLDAEDWLEMPGRLTDEGLVALYQRAWVVTSASVREGWGMTMTEAAACGTTAVVTKIAGHLDAVFDGVTGVVADGRDEMVSALTRVLQDHDLREQFARHAYDRASKLTWEATALTCLQALAGDAFRRQGTRDRR